jgi:hypothetical protein
MRRFKKHPRKADEEQNLLKKKITNAKPTEEKIFEDEPVELTP